MGNELAARPAKFRDAQGRPLHPRGRTGIAGRGLLGRWGSNLAVAALVVRPTEGPDHLEVLLGQQPGQTRLELPQGFLRPGETPEAGAVRVLAAETGCRLSSRAEPLPQA